MICTHDQMRLIMHQEQQSSRPTCLAKYVTGHALQYFSASVQPLAYLGILEMTERLVQHV